MGNFFLGFPVGRAKIADMIATDAPPSLHGSQHEDGGADEIDASGLTGAGAGTPLEDFLWSTAFESIDNYQSVSGSGGSITAGYNAITLACDGTLNAYYELQKQIALHMPALTFAKNRRMLVKARFSNATDQYGEAYITWGRHSDQGNHIGFWLDDGVLKGTCGRGATQYTVTLETLATGSFTEDRRLEAKLIPGTGAEFWVDGVLLGSLGSIYIPITSTYANEIVCLRVDDSGSTTPIQLLASYLKLWQEA